MHRLPEAPWPYGFIKTIKYCRISWRSCICSNKTTDNRKRKQYRKIIKVKSVNDAFRFQSCQDNSRNDTTEHSIEKTIGIESPPVPFQHIGCYITSIKSGH